MKQITNLKSKIDDRSRLLLGDGFEILKNIKVAVIGLGGVGSIVPISLVRSGVRNLLILDKDIVEESNLNRQMAYDLKDLKEYKADIMKNKLLKIRNDLDIHSYNLSIDSSFDFTLLDGYDYILDCIDDISAKVNLIEYAIKNNKIIISSLGMGNRLDPSKVNITKLNKTTNDPLAKKFRYLLRKKSIDLSKINVIFSNEEPIIKSSMISSMAFVPNEAGLLMASFVIKDAIKRGEMYETRNN